MKRLFRNLMLALFALALLLVSTSVGERVMTASVVQQTTFTVIGISART